MLSYFNTSQNVLHAPFFMRSLAFTSFLLTLVPVPGPQGLEIAETNEIR